MTSLPAAGMASAALVLGVCAATPTAYAEGPEGPASRPSPAVADLPAPTRAPAALRWPGAQEMIERLATAVERDAGAGDWALARLYRLWNLNRLLDRSARVDRALTVAIAKGTPLVSHHARFLQATLQRRSGKIDEARTHLEHLGLITDGWLIGPFDNAAGAGHETQFAPETEIDLAAELQSRGRPVRWRRLRGLAPDGVIELSHLLPAAEEATAYVAVVAHAQRQTDATLRTGSTDALRVWLNGVEVLAKDQRRFAFLDQDAVGVRLQKGPNILLFKVSWQGTQGRLFARLTQSSGKRLNGVRIDGGSDLKASAGGGKKVRALSKRRVRAVTDALKRRPRRVDRVEWLALRADMTAVMGLYDTRRLPTPAEELLMDAVRARPNDPHLRFFLAHRVKPRDPKFAREQLKAALTSDPGYAPAWLALGEMARQGQRLLEARNNIDTAIEKDPSFLAAATTRAVLGFEELAEGILAVRRLTQIPAAGESAQARVQLGRMRRALNDAKGARLDLEAGLALDSTHRVARQVLIDLALEADDGANARRLAAGQVAIEPWSVLHRLRQITLLTESDPEGARRLLVETEALFPTHPEVPALRADLDLLAGRRAAALAALDRSLGLHPHQPNLRRHRRRLAGGGRDLAEVYGTDAIKAAGVPASDAERKFGAAFLTDRTAIELTASGRSTKYRQQLIRLAHPGMKDALRAHRVFYSPSRENVEILSAEQIKPTGQIVKAAAIRDDGPRGKVGGMYVDQRYKVIVFGELAPGDTLHIAYRIDSRGENIFGGFFGDVEAVQGLLPKSDVHYTVIAPHSRPLYYATVRLPDPVRDQTKTHHRLRWNLPEIAGLDLEPLGPPYPRIGRLLSVSTYDAWDVLGRWYARLYGDQLELDEAARQAGRAAVAGIEDQAEKVRRLYGYVVKNTRYVGIELGIHGWKPYKASEVHRRRYGDCKDKSTLLSALLRDNGIDATITLVRTSDRGSLPKEHATMWAFNHAITYVPELDWYLDPTAEFNGSTELPYQDQGAMALVVHPDGRTKLTSLPISTPRDNLNASKYVAELKEDGRLVMKGREEFHGARAAELRQQLQEEDTRKRLLERQLGQVFPGVRIRNLEVSNIDALEKPVWYQYQFEVPKYGQRNGQRWLIPVALYQHEVSKAYAQLTARQHPVRVKHAWETNNVIEYRLPKGAKLARVPEGISIDTPYISLKQTIRRVDNGFETNDTVTLKQREIPPEAYVEFRRACLAIDRAMNRKVEIQW